MVRISFFSLRKKNDLIARCYLVTVWETSCFPECKPLTFEVYALDDDVALGMVFEKYDKSKYYIGVLLKSDANRIR